MDTEYTKIFIDRLRRWDFTIAPGLSIDEMKEIEERYGFQFPPDLKYFLQQALPVSDGWVNWRNGPKGEIQERLNWPIEGILFDVEHSAFWLDAWGKKPETLGEALEAAREEVLKAPVLIPIVSHCYIPAEPSLAGTPVYSVYQTDIIYYGFNLASYFENAFTEGQDGYRVSGHYQPDIFQKIPRAIRFWDNVVDSWQI